MLVDLLPSPSSHGLLEIIAKIPSFQVSNKFKLVLKSLYSVTNLVLIFDSQTMAWVDKLTQVLSLVIHCVMYCLLNLI